ncbi:branched-chain alpha-ketoacid dehydrogenase [Kalaharituber pfeilii]|nr:branched-chain alpha-ketoacid dehydrogenase [Kalaharituber pfeilii]
MSPCFVQLSISLQKVLNVTGSYILRCSHHVKPNRLLHTTLPVTNSIQHAPIAQAPSLSSNLRWRSSSVLDSYVDKPARPISLRQLIFFGGRNLDEARILNSANYVRTELPIRIAHRIRDMQKLPYVVVTNPHMSHVYDLYYKAFETLRKVPEVKTIEDNDKLCNIIKKALKEHLTVIPNLAMGVLECRHLLPASEIDKFMNKLLRSRISRRVIAEQHLALTETFNSPFHFPNVSPFQQPSSHPDFVGEVFLRCNAKDVVERCGNLAQDLAREAYGSQSVLPEIEIEGHTDTTFPYIPSHLEYMIGELLRNSIQATVETHHPTSPDTKLPPIRVLICHAPQHIIFRVSDQGGGIPAQVLPHIWSFSKGSRSQAQLENLAQVPAMAATMQELINSHGHRSDAFYRRDMARAESSLSSLSSRPPDLRLGMGLPMSRVYAEYWAGKLELHSLEGYGTDAFLQISKLGNKSEQLNLDGL